MRAHICSRCGENLVEKGEKYLCPYCHAEFDKNDVFDELTSYFEASKMELLANKRRILYDCAHQQNISSSDLIKASQDVLSISSDDVLANFYKAALDEDPATLNAFLSKLKTDPFVAKEILRFCMLSLEMRNVFALKSFLEKHLKGDELLNAYNEIEKEAERVEEGTYMTNLPRDVFLAYSSLDLPKAIELTDFLEDNEFTVFVAVRNLRHGKGAKEHYFDALADAMAHCKTLIFLSSENSRSLNCDATRYELPYIRDNLPNMNRIEYLVEDYGPKTKLAAKTILKSVFKDLEWCRDEEDLVMRLLDYDKPKISNGAKPKNDDYVIVEKDDQKPAQDIHKDAANNNPKQQNSSQNPSNFDSSSNNKSGDSNRASHKEDEPKAEVTGGKFKRFIKGVYNVVKENIAKEAEDKKEHAAEILRDCEIRNGVLVKYKGHSKSLTIPESVRAIGEYAFSGVSSVEAVVLPQTIERIGSYAFNGCSGLRKIAIPHVRSLAVDEYAFNGCVNLAAISIKALTLRIGTYAFFGARNLSAAVFVSENITICEYAFDGCVNLLKFETGSSTKSMTIGAYAFFGCSKIRVIKIPTGSIKIGAYAFASCPTSATVIYPKHTKLDRTSFK